jgi:hypothetical protein
MLIQRNGGQGLRASRVGKPRIYLQAGKSLGKRESGNYQDPFGTSLIQRIETEA